MLDPMAGRAGKDSLTAAAGDVDVGLLPASGVGVAPNVKEGTVAASAAVAELPFGADLPFTVGVAGNASFAPVADGADGATFVAKRACCCCKCFCCWLWRSEW